MNINLNFIIPPHCSKKRKRISLSEPLKTYHKFLHMKLTLCN